MLDGKFSIKSNRCLAPAVYELKLKGDCSGLTRAGQFVNVRLDGFFLRRPFAAADWTEDTLTVLYKVVGHGTEALSKMQEGSLDVLTGLGNGFDTALPAKTVVLAGGGMGIAPLRMLAKELSNQGKKVISVLGFNTAEDVCYVNEFRSYGEVKVATLDGSAGTKGFVTDVMETLDFDCFYACGPLVMEKAVCLGTEKPGQVSLEARMGCGTGICMGCTIITKNGPRRICADGPVFCKEDLIW